MTKTPIKKPAAKPASKPKTTMPPSPKTSEPVKHAAGLGLKSPRKLTPIQEQALAGSVERHIEPRGGKKTKAAAEKAPAKKAAPAAKARTKVDTPSKAKSKTLMKFR